jgi:hypothetical protein
MRISVWPYVPANCLQRVILACQLLALAFFLLIPPGLLAQNIESVMSPGKLIQGHARVDDDCKQCHVKFDRKAQDGLCMDCHKEIGADVRGKNGFHGKSNTQACRTCHTDHKGRDARIADFDKQKFDHALTDFTLRGKHPQVECGQCHASGKKFRDAPRECMACHKKDDVHKGSLGPQCADCHTESNWKQARFDHDKSRFPLTGRHIDVKCVDCHKNSNFKETPRTCIGCHKKDDDLKGHKGQFGEKCESCHAVKSWKESSFNHDTDTKYSLRGKHRSTTCVTCHTGHLYKVKLSQECVSCHIKDDKHKETLGKNCGACHSERNWKESPKFDHQSTSFPLLGKHLKTDCKECHKSALYKEAPKACIGCHKKDDKHEGNLGEACTGCHIERDWKTTAGRFSHDKTRFALRNAHAEKLLKCNACHKDLSSMRNTPLECFSCHQKDDKHAGQEGKKCEQCHSDRSWKDTRFDHGLSRFPLTGRHINTACKKCHETSRYKDASRDCYACHKNEDKHKQKFGMQCDNCHNTRAWSLWHFEHDIKTSYKLDGSHRKVACEGCHKEPAPKGKNAAVLGSNCLGCHRNEDVHDGQFGGRCEQCHGTDNWKKFKNRVGKLSLYPSQEMAMQALPGPNKQRWMQ